MHDETRNIIITILLLFVFVGVLALPSPPQASTANNKISLIDGALDFGIGTDDFISSKDSELSFISNEYNSVLITHKLTASKLYSGNLSIKAQKSIFIGKTGSIDYSGVQSLGVAEDPKSTKGIISGSGGSHGGRGGGGQCVNTPQQNGYLGQIDILPTLGQAGSVGTSGNKGVGGLGGGFILLEAPEITIDGSLVANGTDGIENGGGGAGGKIVLLANKIIISGVVSAKGGAGGTSFMQGAGGGGGGIIVLSATYTGNGKLDVSGGLGGKALDIYTGCDGQSGGNGIIATP